MPFARASGFPAKASPTSKLRVSITMALALSMPSCRSPLIPKDAKAASNKAVSRPRSGRDERDPVEQVPADGIDAVLLPPREQNPLGHVQARVFEGLKIAAQVLFEQVVVHEGPVLFVSKVRDDHVLEELRILLSEEEAQLMAGILGIQLALLCGLEFRPVGR